jgi:regulator of sigma E protease
MISSNLGVMNLLPIPALDGGRFLFFLIEAIRGKKIPEDKEGTIHMIGLIFLLALMVLIMINDIKNILF